MLTLTCLHVYLFLINSSAKLNSDFLLSLHEKIKAH